MNLGSRTSMTRTLILLALLPLLAACSSLSEKSNSPLAGSNQTILGKTAPGLGDLWAPTKEEKEDADWWSGYYGNKKASE